MTETSEKVFEDFFSKALSFQGSQYRFREACIRAMKEFVKEKDRNTAENAVMEAVKPFREEQELEIYKAAKKFVEMYEANDLAK